MQDIEVIEMCLRALNALASYHYKAKLSWNADINTQLENFQRPNEMSTEHIMQHFLHSLTHLLFLENFRWKHVSIIMIFLWKCSLLVWLVSGYLFWKKSYTNYLDWLCYGPFFHNREREEGKSEKPLSCELVSESGFIFYSILMAFHKRYKGLFTYSARIGPNFLFHCI